MKRLFAIVAILVGMVGSPSVWASTECPVGSVLKSIGTPLTVTGALSTQGQDVRQFWVMSTGSASVVGVYDTTTESGATTANLKFEYGAAASAFAQAPTTGFFTSPMRFTNGVFFVFSNVTAAGALSCQVP